MEGEEGLDVDVDAVGRSSRSGRHCRLRERDCGMMEVGGGMVRSWSGWMRLGVGKVGKGG